MNGIIFDLKNNFLEEEDGKKAQQHFTLLLWKHQVVENNRAGIFCQLQ